MRKGWEYKKLGEVCTIKAGYTPPKDELFDNGAYPYYKVADMNTLGNDVYLDITSSYKIDANKLFPKGAIVFPKNGAAVSTNKKRILKYDSIVDLNTGVAIFQKSINEKFAYYWFIDTDFKKYVRGGALPTLDIKSLKDKPFPSIEKSTQLAIVSELDKINELIRLKKEQLKDFDNLAQSLFYEMFGDPVENEKGWEVKKLGELLKVIGGYAFKSDKYKEEGIPILRIGNINSGVFRDINLVFAESDEKLERYKIFPGDIVISLTGTVGKSDYGNVCIMDDTYNFYYLNQRNAKLEIFGNLDKYYLSAILKNEVIKSRLTSISRGVRQANIANKDIENLQIPLPPLTLQRLFAQRIEQVEREKSEVQKSIQDLETLLASRMQYWFE